MSPSRPAWELERGDLRPRHRLQGEGASLAFGVAGERGAPVLLIMGYIVPGSAWMHQVPALAAHHRVAWYDHRGCGDSRAAPGLYSMALLARDALRLLDHLGWERVHIVGVSMGGMVSQELALRWPERVRSLSLIATHAGGMRSRIPPINGLLAFARANLAAAPDRNQTIAKLLFPAHYLASCDRQWLSSVLENDFGRPVPAKLKLSQLAAVLRHDTRSRLHRLGEIPTLVVCPGQDLLVSPKACRDLCRRIPGARMCSFPEAGHGVVRQRADSLNRALLAHFAAADH